MRNNIGDVWTEMQGKTKVWRVQFPNGICTFKKKNIADKWSNQLRKEQEYLEKVCGGC